MATMKEIAEQVRRDLEGRDLEAASNRLELHGRNAKRVWTQRNRRAENRRRACRG